jgi:hypothetical protein
MSSMLVTADHSLATLITMTEQAKARLAEHSRTQDRHHRDLLPLLEAQKIHTGVEGDQTRADGLRTIERVHTELSQHVSQAASEQRAALAALAKEVTWSQADLLEKVQGVQTSVDTRVESVEKRVQGVEKKVDKILELLVSIDKKVDKMQYR